MGGARDRAGCDGGGGTPPPPGGAGREAASSALLPRLPQPPRCQPGGQRPRLGGLPLLPLMQPVLLWGRAAASHGCKPLPLQRQANPFAPPAPPTSVLPLPALPHVFACSRQEQPRMPGPPTWCEPQVHSHSHKPPAAPPASCTDARSRPGPCHAPPPHPCQLPQCSPHTPFRSGGCVPHPTPPHT